MKVNYVMKAWYKKVLSLLICSLSTTGYAQSTGWQETSRINSEPARWYFGVEYGIPFLFGELTAFSADKTYLGYQIGGFAGYRFNHKIGLEFSAGTGGTKLGSKSYATDYLVDEEGMTYYVGQAFPTWAYKDIYSKVQYINIGLQANINLNNLFSTVPRERRWTVLLSPAIYMQHFSPDLYVKADKNRLKGGSTDKLNIGLGGNLALRYNASRLFDLQLRTGVIWVNNNKMDGVSTLIKSKDHFMVSTGIALIWKTGRTSSTRN